jgi:hypothetical protein
MSLTTPLDFLFACALHLSFSLSHTHTHTHTHIGFRVVTNEVRTADKGWEESLKTSPCYES